MRIYLCFKPIDVAEFLLLRTTEGVWLRLNWSMATTTTTIRILVTFFKLFFVNGREGLSLAPQKRLHGPEYWFNISTHLFLPIFLVLAGFAFHNNNRDRHLFAVSLFSLSLFALIKCWFRVCNICLLSETSMLLIFM